MIAKRPKPVERVIKSLPPGLKTKAPGHANGRTSGLSEREKRVPAPKAGCGIYSLREAPSKVIFW